MKGQQPSISQEETASMAGYGPEYLARQGAKLRSAANDLKRTAAALGKELDEETATIDATFIGTATVEVVNRVIDKMVATYPISKVDLDIKRDDTDEGVVLQTPEGARASSRIFDRSDALGRQAPYYEYRDAAMSSVGPYRPEWIKELRTVKTTDATDPDVSYNSGHMLHQATFFVGPVNFYWKIGDAFYIDQMDTGDSNYITPFVPHSFASRDPNLEAYIVAVTFNGKLESVHQEVMLLDPKGVEEALFDLSNQPRAFAGILNRELAGAMLSPEHLSQKSGLSDFRLASFLDGSQFPAMEEIAAISHVLGINRRDLLPPEASAPIEVVVRHAYAGDLRAFPSEEVPSYRVQDLAGSRKVPFLKCMMVQPQKSSTESATPVLDLLTASHEFCYNYGTESTVLHWRSNSGIRSAVVEPGGSYYLKPTIPHALRCSNPSVPSKVVVMRVGGALYGDAHLEMSSYPVEALYRIFKESQQWYDPSKIGG